MICHTVWNLYRVNYPYHFGRGLHSECFADAVVISHCPCFLPVCTSCLLCTQLLKSPPTGVSTEGGEATAASWKWYSLMDEALGARPSVTPRVLIASSSHDAVVVTPLSVPTQQEREAGTLSTSSTPKRKRVDAVETIREIQARDEEEFRRMQEEEREREDRREEARRREVAEARGQREKKGRRDASRSYLRGIRDAIGRLLRGSRGWHVS